MVNYYQFIIPRLNGAEIGRNFAHYRSLVRKGVAGFIVFGGQIGQIRKYVRKLQSEAELPLIIASDLEQGLGQQVKGGTLFPPAMAVAEAVKKISRIDGERRALRTLKDTYKAIAVESAYAGINTIFAPVLDINTNPDNPIIAVRAFGEDAKTVSFFGSTMIKALQRSGIAACGKHFPGHGNTKTDSHIRLPSVMRSKRGLCSKELKPFQNAIDTGVKMLMLGHLNVPAITSSTVPVSLSGEAVRYVREDMKFRGVLVTDALNMGGIGRYTEEAAARMALHAGVDILLHPTDADSVVSYLRKRHVEADPGNLRNFRMRLKKIRDIDSFDRERHQSLSDYLCRTAVKVSGSFRIRNGLVLVILNDDKDDDTGKILIQQLSRSHPGLKVINLGEKPGSEKISLPADAPVVVALFSETRAWKGGAGRWLRRRLVSLRDRADVFVSFGSPYLLAGIRGPKITIFWDSASAEKAAAEVIGRSG